MLAHSYVGTEKRWKEKWHSERLLFALSPKPIFLVILCEIIQQIVLTKHFDWTRGPPLQQHWEFYASLDITGVLINSHQIPPALRPDPTVLRSGGGGPNITGLKYVTFSCIARCVHVGVWSPRVTFSGVVRCVLSACREKLFAAAATRGSWTESQLQTEVFNMRSK